RLSKIEGYETLSVFELTAAIAFVAFYEKSADFTLLEVGLGGRLDASNVIKNPLLSVITTIDYDHQNFLGNTLTQIAYEKAAIIKRNGTAITDYQDKSVLRAIKKYARHMQAALFCGGEDYQLNGNVLSYQNKKITLPQLPLLGAHQYYNVSTAIVSCINILKDKFDYDNLDTYLAKTAWAGRLQKVDSLYGVNFRKTSLFLDGAHNVSGSKALCGFIDGYESATNIHIFLGMLKKKDLDGFLANIAALKDRFNIVIYPLEIDGHESYAAEEILQKAREHNLNGNPVNLSKKLAEIEDSTGKNLIIICGSLYLLGKVLGDNL
ncbi:MAG: hypothetical protein LBQ34_00205, partial [Alphaproteobacteria bacterium]|nr:hypothetical protein [Alphaproteobacteria bacterium]